MGVNEVAVPEVELQNGDGDGVCGEQNYIPYMVSISHCKSKLNHDNHQEHDGGGASGKT